MENRKLNQIVFVIMDNYEEKIVGVYNDYLEAVQVAEAAEKHFYEDSFITITPVLVDTVNIVPDSRKLYWDEQGVVDALQEEIDLAMPYVEEEEEEEEEDEEEEEYEEDEEDEDTDPIDDMIFDYKGKRSISESDGKLMFNMCVEIVRERNPRMSVDQQVNMAQQLFLAVAREHGIEWVKEDEDE